MLAGLLISGSTFAQQDMLNAPSEAYTATCQDVIDAKDEAAISQSMIAVRELAFKVSAQQQASLLYKGLVNRGVTNPLPAVLDQYETLYVPVRDGAGAIFDHIVTQHGSFKNAILKLCPDRKEQMFNFFAKFYEVALQRKTELQTKQQSQP
jgi:hypothetical protein